jgi:hypothetical protein
MEISESGNIEIYNIKGQLLHTQSIEKGKNILLMQNWEKGLYLLKFKNKTYKLVIGWCLFVFLYYIVCWLMVIS